VRPSGSLRHLPGSFVGIIAGSGPERSTYPPVRICAATSWRLRVWVCPIIDDNPWQSIHADLATVRAAGFSEANIVQVIALSAQCNFVNNAFDTEIDFPVVDLEVV
jgi:hypothetical protein